LERIQSTLRLDLSAIEGALRKVQRDFAHINADLTSRRDPLGEEVLNNLIAGYAFLDRLQEADIDLFAIGNSALLLQLNCLVLCGSTDTESQSCKPHFSETERRFYDDSNPGGVRSLMNYLADHPEPSIWRRAAGVYIQILSEPQLFFEGNHRTGTLLMNHVLLRGGKPPFILTEENAKDYFNPSSLVKGFRKRSFRAFLDIPRMQTRLANLLQNAEDPRYLLNGSQPDAASRSNVGRRTNL